MATCILSAELFAIHAYEREVQNDSTIINALLDSSEVLFQDDRLAAYSMLHKAERLAAGTHNAGLYARSLAIRGWFNGKEGKYEKAGGALDSAYSIFLSEGFLSDAAAIKRQLGIHFTDQGVYEAAMNNFIEGSRLAEQAGDLRMVAKCFRGIAYLYYQHNDVEMAREYIERAVNALQSATYDSLDLTDMWQTKAIVLRGLGATDSAIHYYRLNADYYSRVNNLSSLAGTLNNLALIYENEGKYDLALTYYQQCLDIDTTLDDPLGMTYSHIGCANSYHKMDRLDSALYHARESFRIATSLHANQRIMKAGESLVAIHKSMQSYDSALYYAELTASVRETMFGEEKVRTAYELEKKYESEKRRDEIALLNQQKAAAEFRKNSYLVAGVSLIGILGLLYYQQRQRVIKNRKLLEKEQHLDRMKSQFIANVSHEFRTPLTLILGPVNDFIASGEAPSLQGQFRLMQKNARRLLELINQLLDLSKIESGKMELSTAPGDITALIKGISNSFESIAELNSIDLNVISEDENVQINFDHEKVSTILTNLLSNAFKFTPNHGSIVVKAFRQLNCSAVDSVVFVVRDSGQGIPERDLSEIFNRFYQSGNPDFQKNQGTGIGLALTRELVELHGGSIEVKSKLNYGTEFTVRLPVNLPASSTETPLSVELGEPLIADQPGEHANAFGQGLIHDKRPVVLIVEDNSDVRRYISDSLRGSYRILEAENGETGIETAIQEMPDLIVSDVMMPAKNGFELCSFLKNKQETCHIPIILLSARSESEDKLQGLETRADDYVVKPFESRELLLRVDNQIRSRALLREKYQKSGLLNPKEITINSMDETFLTRMVAHVEENISNEKFSVELLAGYMNMSRSQLHRKLTALLGHGPNQFIRNFRLQYAHNLLEQKSATIAEISYQAGFSSPAYFSKCFHERYGFSPSELN